MTHLLRRSAAVMAAIVFCASAAEAQTVSRTADGKPDLSGIWQVMNTANFDIQDHSASKGVPAGIGVVEGNEIPYKPEALAKKRQNFANRATADPETKCYLPGVPRIMYMPHPFQIFQKPEQITMLFEYVHATRFIYTNGSKHPEGHIDWWMGDSRGRWEGDTLVVDVVDFNEETWLDRAGNFHSDELHLVERLTPLDADHINYEVTVEDPKVFTRPWRMSMILYRHKERNAQLLEYDCYGFDTAFHAPPPSDAPVALAANGSPPPQPVAAPPPGWIDPRNPPKEDPTFAPPRTADGQPKIEGEWAQASDIITYSIEDPELERAEHTAISGQRPMVGRPIIDPIDGKIPYQPWAVKYAAFLHEEHRKPSSIRYLDPVSRGFQEGVPRINYQGTFQIQQFAGAVLFTYDYHHTYRVIPLDGRPHVGKDITLWMGDARGHWEGNTLVVDVANNNDQAWLQIVGGFHSDAFHVVERWTITSPDHIVYLATIDDAKVYSRPWTLRVDMRRQKVDEQWESAIWEGNKTPEIVSGSDK